MSDDRMQKQLDNLTEENFKHTNCYYPLNELVRSRTEWEIVKLYEQGKDFSDSLLDKECIAQRWSQYMSENLVVVIADKLSFYVPKSIGPEFTIFNPHHRIESAKHYLDKLTIDGQELDITCMEKGLQVLLQNPENRELIRKVTLDDIAFIKAIIATGDRQKIRDGLNMTRTKTRGGVALLPPLMELATVYLGQMKQKLIFKGS